MAGVGSAEWRLRTPGGPYFVRSEVAHALSCSTGLLSAIRQQDPQNLGPSFAVDVARRSVALYTLGDVERLLAHLEGRRPYLSVDAAVGVPPVPGRWQGGDGPRTLFTAAEARERGRRQSAARRLRLRAEREARAGHVDAALRTSRERAAILSGLHEERVARERAGDLSHAPENASDARRPSK